MFTIKGLNHIVLFVSDLDRSLEFYSQILQFKVRERLGDQAVFMYANGSPNHHDLGLMVPGTNPTPLAPDPRIGLYHSAWEVDKIEQLRDAKAALVSAKAFLGESDHGNSLSLYAHDPDNNEFEIFWMFPADEWDKREFGVHKLDLEGEIAKRIHQS